jgi:hypothetical protein
MIPLPCPRDLWSLDGASSLPSRLKRHMSSANSRKMLTLGDLKRCRGRDVPRDVAKGVDGGKAIIGHNDGDLADVALLNDMTAWCERLDEFGLLIWHVGAL